MRSSFHFRKALRAAFLLGVFFLGGLASEGQARPFQSTEFDGSVTDPVRGRDIPYRVYAPANATGSTPLVLVSHGGTGSLMGYTRLGHLGEHYANEGYLAIHVGHVASIPAGIHRLDRPRDVSYLLDRIELETLPLPPTFAGSIDMTRVGHIGHSWGAYTAHALAGADFDHGNFRDTRIRSIATLSPQGPGAFGAFDRGPSDNTWAGITVPVYVLYGALEADFDVTRTIYMAGWRGYPFARYRTQDDCFLSVLPGADHLDMGNFGSLEQNAFVATNTRLFFDATLRDDLSAVCEIGRSLPVSDVTDSRRYDPQLSSASGCCGPTSGTQSFACVADATLDEASPDLVDSTSSALELQVDGGAFERRSAILQFRVFDLQGEVTSAVLRIDPVSFGSGSIAVYATTTESEEGTSTWNDSPAGLELLDTAQWSGSTLEWDVTDFIRSVGFYGLRLEAFGPAGDAHTLPSRESSTPPELVVTTLAVPAGSPALAPCVLPAGRSFCLGDGDADSPGCTPCPCGNDAPPGTSGGCLNAAGTSAELRAVGESRISADSLQFSLVGGSPSSFALLFSADRILPGSAGDPCHAFESGVFSPAFDGLRCIGGGLVRHGTRATDASGNVGVTTNGWSGVVAAGGFAAGQVSRFQVVYRSDVHGTCGSGQNTTQGLELVFRP